MSIQPETKSSEFVVSFGLSGLFERAVESALKWHFGQFRKGSSHLPYIVHPLGVASLVRQLAPKSKNLETLMAAAVLHDVCEDCEVTPVEIEQQFGVEISNLVQELTSDPEQIKLMGKTDYLVEKVSKMSNDAAMIKMCDRLDNLRDMGTLVGQEKWIENYKIQSLLLVEKLEKCGVVVRSGPLYTVLQQIRMACY